MALASQALWNSLHTVHIPQACLSLGSSHSLALSPAGLRLKPELLWMEEQDTEALDILTPLLLMRKLSAEKFQEQVAGIQARNQIPERLLGSSHIEAHFLQDLQMSITVSAPSVAHFSPRWQSASFTGDTQPPSSSSLGGPARWSHL